MQALHALLGGVLIGLAASLLLLVNGRVAGVSGIAGGLLPPAPGEAGWRVAFLGGLVLGGVLLGMVFPQVLGGPVTSKAWVAALAGVLVGVGARLGKGCTSGHGVCGLSRGALHSLVATMTFMVTGAATVFVVRHVIGGGP